MSIRLLNWPRDGSIPKRALVLSTSSEENFEHIIKVLSDYCVEVPTILHSDQIKVQIWDSELIASLL